MDRYFPEFGTVNDLKPLGYVWTFVSVFDHWLSEADAETCPIMNYSSARSGNELTAYMAGEEQFRRFYAALAQQGCTCNHPGPRRSLVCPSQAFDDVIIASLREQRLMDVYFPGPKVRVVGGYDRTDIIIASTQAEIDALRPLKDSTGLHFLA